MQASLRAASAADLGILIPWIQAFYAEEGIVFHETRTRSALAQLMGNERLGNLCVIFSGSEPIGYLVLIRSFILEFGGPQFFVDELYLCPEARGRGHARAALVEVEKIARSQGIAVLRLEVNDNNARALSLYRKAGYERHARCTMTKILTLDDVASSEPLQRSTRSAHASTIPPAKPSLL